MEEKRVNKKAIEFILMAAALCIAYRLGQNSGYNKGVQDVFNVLDFSQK